MADFIPSREGDMVPWAQNFSSGVSAAPVPLGLTASDATSLASLVSAFVAARDLVTDPATNTEVARTNRDVAKAALIADIRSLARRIQANPAVSAGQKTALGLPIHNAVPTPTPVPNTSPMLGITDAGIRTLTIRITDETTPTKRARPPGTAGAEIYSFVPAAPGEPPPPDLELWRYEGLATRAEFVVDFNQADVGKNALVCAAWINRTGQRGPASAPVTRLIAA